MATMPHLLPSSLHRNYNNVHDSRRFFYQEAVSFQSPQNLSFIPLGTKVCTPTLLERFDLSCAGNGGGGSGVGHGSGGNGGGDCGSGWSGGEHEESDSLSSWWQGFGILGFFMNGWRSRVAADPQFPFKVLIVGVSLCVSLWVLGYMASKALASFFSTLVGECMLHMAVMYLLAPRMSPSLFLLLRFK